MTTPLDRKITTIAAIAPHLDHAQRAGKTIVQCHGCFDLVHPGHIRYLQFARQLGDILVVSLTGDASITKGPDRPYIPQELRAENLAALEFVDWVLIDPNPTAAELLDHLRPDVYVKGREYAASSDPRFLRERAIVESYGGRIAFHSGDIVFSSTQLIESVRGDHDLDQQRLHALCRRHGLDLDALIGVLDRIARLRVLVVGDLTWERYVLCDAESVPDEAPILRGQHLATVEYAGGAAAVALQAAALGARVVLVGGAGADAVTRRCAERLETERVVHHLLPVRARTVLRTTFVADDTKLFKYVEGAPASLDTASERLIAAAVDEHLGQADVVLLSDQGFGTLAPGLLTQISMAAKSRPIFIAGSASGPGSSLSGLTGLHLLTATERQVRDAVQDRAASLPAVVWNLLNQSRNPRALISLRKRGVILFDGTEPYPAIAPAELAAGYISDAPRSRLRSEYVPTFAAHFADAGGGEEALLASAGLALALGAQAGLATYLASACESLAIEEFGIHAVSGDRLRAWLERRPELRYASRFVPSPRPSPREELACPAPF